MTTKCVILAFMDATHVLIQPIVSNVWISMDLITTNDANLARMKIVSLVLQIISFANNV
jgi:hypothetical protein